MTVTFADKLRRIPSYQAGVPKGKAPEAIADGVAVLGRVLREQIEAGLETAP